MEKKEYFCSIEWSVCVDAESEEDAQEKAWEIWNEGDADCMKVEEN